jgi:hypothetical protein
LQRGNFLFYNDHFDNINNEFSKKKKSSSHIITYPTSFGQEKTSIQPIKPEELNKSERDTNQVANLDFLLFFYFLLFAIYSNIFDI